jgi:hypothetical protein
MASLNGRKALTEIDKFLSSVRGHLTNIDLEFGNTRAALARLRSKEIGLYAELAKLRLLAIEQEDVLDALDNADREATAILDEREAAADELDGKVRAAETALAEDEQRRAAQQQLVDAASETLDAAEADAQERLTTDEAYRAQLAQTEQADFVADQAEDKAAAATSDRIGKGKPYEDDPLFSYLWTRGFGTSRYRAFPLMRWLDGRVAKVCSYEPARRNYALLVEIPERLGEHATAMRARFEREAEALAELEEAAAAEAGVPERQRELESAEQALESVDTAIAEREDEIRDLRAERGRFAAGDDDLYQRCIAVLSGAMQRKSIDFLRERAARTVRRDDDEIVRQLAELDREARRTENNLSEFQQLHDRESNRLRQLEDLRRRFKAERFADPFSEFRDWALIALVLREFLRGAAGSADVWKTMKRQQRTRRVKANPHFGTLRFPRAPKPGPWRMPKGGFGGGGFRTGGGFKGGGGFKTGGGF